MPLLELKKISKSFGISAVLKNISFSIDSQEITVVLGKSGVGKTTLIKLICGITNPSSGSIDFKFCNNVEPGIFNGIGYVPQSPSLLNTKSIQDNILLPLRLTGRKNNNIDDLIDMLGLRDILHKYPSQLSRGQAQRVSLARAMVLNPSLLVLDEPFASIDEMSKGDLDTILINLRNKYHISILMVTHSIEEAVYIADKILILKNSGIDSLYEITFNGSDRNPSIKMLGKFFDYQKEVREGLL